MLKIYLEVSREGKYPSFLDKGLRFYLKFQFVRNTYLYKFFTEDYYANFYC